MRLLLIFLLLPLACAHPLPAEVTDAPNADADAGTADLPPDPCADVQKLHAGWTEFDLNDAATATDLGPAHSVKIMVLNARTTADLYYIAPSYPLHYDFAHATWPQTYPTREDFDAQLYHAPNHPHANATLIYYPEWQIQHLPSTNFPQPPPWKAPMTLQFFQVDQAPLDVVKAVYQRVLAGIPQTECGDRRLIWIPQNLELETEARAHEQELADQGILWATEAELYAAVRQQSMNNGVAFGTLRNVTDEQLAAGALSYRDIIVLNRLPLNLPLVGGTITAEMQTPLAHVNVVAKARRTPNLALKEAVTDPRVAPLLGKPVRFEVMTGGFTLREATPEEVNAYWDNRLNQQEFVPALDLSVPPTAVVNLDTLGFSASPAYGVKASNYAELRKNWREEAANVLKLTGGAHDAFTEPGLGVPFSAYVQHVNHNVVDAVACDAMTADCANDSAFDPAGCAHAGAACHAVLAAGTLSIRDWIVATLARADFRADSFLRAAALRGFRWAIEHAPVDSTFAAALDAATWKLFTTPDGNFGVIKHKFRMRSSTNAEDLAGFTGAGLYESFTAEVDGSKRASSRIRKVWGSIWTFRAFEERSFWRISHLDVAMGILINPDHPNEICNGVIITENLAEPEWPGFYVNAQLGENSVTNPLGGITPEVFTMIWQYAQEPRFSGDLDVFVNRLEFSSLSPHSSVLPEPFPNVLLNAMHLAVGHFSSLYDKQVGEMAFDAEWKVQPDENGKPQLIIKQIRPF